MAYLILKKGTGAAVQIPIENASVTLGRSKKNDVCIEDTLVSKLHCRIDAVPGEGEVSGDIEYYIEDLNSTNSTFVNNRKVTRKILKHDDLIRVLLSQLQFVLFDVENTMESTAVIKKSWIPGVYYTQDKESKNKSERKKKKE